MVEMNYWLFKTEPDEYSIDDLRTCNKGTDVWNGIRNYQARNFLRDQVAVGDQVFIYHSQCRPVGIAGIAEVVQAAYPDPLQFDSSTDYFDVKATPENPRWFNVDVKFVEKFSAIIPLADLKACEELTDMVLIKQGRLSIQPVTAREWQIVMGMAK